MSASPARRLLKVATGSGVVQLAGKLLALLVSVQLARTLGVAQYGIYGVFMSIVMLSGAVGRFGVPMLATRELAMAQATRNWPLLRGAFTWTAAAMLLLSVPIGMLAYLLTFAFELDYQGDAALIVALAMACSLLVFTGAALRGLQRIVLGMSMDMVVQRLLFAICVTACFFGAAALNLTNVLLLYLMAVVCALLLGIFLLMRAMPGDVFAAAPVFKSREWTRRVMPLGLTATMNELLAQFPIFMLSMLVAPVEIGVFAVALTAAGISKMPDGMVRMNTLPMATAMLARGERRQVELLAGTAALLTTLPTAAVVLAFYVCGEWLLGLVYGTEYLDAYTLVVALSLGSLITALFGINQPLLNAAKKEVFVTGATLAALIVSVLLAWLLVPLYNTMGMAWAMVIGLLVRCIALYAACKRLLGLDASLLGAVPVYAHRIRRTLSRQ